VVKRAPKGATGASSSGRPRMSDLKEAGELEQDADWIEFLWRKPEKGQDDEEEAEDASPQITLSVEKNRNGPTRDVSLIFQKTTGRFLNISKIDPHD